MRNKIDVLSLLSRSFERHRRLVQNSNPSLDRLEQRPDLDSPDEMGTGIRKDGCAGVPCLKGHDVHPRCLPYPWAEYASGLSFWARVFDQSAIGEDWFGRIIGQSLKGAGIRCSSSVPRECFNADGLEDNASPVRACTLQHLINAYLLVEPIF